MTIGDPRFFRRTTGTQSPIDLRRRRRRPPRKPLVLRWRKAIGPDVDRGAFDHGEGLRMTAFWWNGERWLRGLLVLQRRAMFLWLPEGILARRAGQQFEIPRGASYGGASPREGRDRLRLEPHVAVVQVLTTSDVYRFAVPIVDVETLRYVVDDWHRND
ncbi:MAG TPA: hypothetical protein VKQ07_04250 [Jatrophihabitantaceae bacterium]|nr:hypothetical protein [Jatrophihabitantaceae bacterium]